MDRDMGTVMNDDMYGFQVRSVSGTGCSDDNTTSNYEIISLNTEYNRHISTISSNILNANQNTLSTLDIRYITYFYYYYSQLLKTFPNLFSKSFIIQIDNLKKYINCSLIKFNLYFNKYLSSISSSLNSNLFNIKSLTTLIPQLRLLVKKVLCNLKTAIGLNITLLCLQINKIDNSIKCCQSKVFESVKIICTINKLISTECNTGIIKCFKNCLKEIKCYLTQLQKEISNLCESYLHIKCLIFRTQNIQCYDYIADLKFVISILIKRYKCSLSEFGEIESQIKCSKSKIGEISRLKAELCKEFDKISLILCITSSDDRFKILIISGDSMKSRLKSLGEKIGNISSQFDIIEDNTTHLKHSLVFNWYYFQISCYILEHLYCIDSEQILLLTLIIFQSNYIHQITLISNNINEVRSILEKMNERIYELGYLSEGLSSIIPLMCQIKESANEIMTKIPNIQCVIEPLNKIKCSIQKLKKLECEEKCLEILECIDKKILKKSLICIRDKLDIKCITDKLEIVQKSLDIFEGISLMKNSFETLSFDMKYIADWIDEVENCLDNIIKRFIRCSVQSLSKQLSMIKNHIVDSTTNNTSRSQINNVVMSVMSRTVIDELIFILSRLYIHHKIKSAISKVLSLLDHCICIKVFEQYYINSVCSYHRGLPHFEDTDSINWDKIQNDVHNKENNSCLCMIIRYRLIPEVYFLVRYTDYFYFDILTILSREFNKYVLKDHDKLSIFKLICLLIKLIYKITLWMTFKYSDDVRKLYCFCNRNDKSFIHLKLIIIKICELIENIWSMDIESVRMAIESVSSFLSEYQSIHVYTNYYSSRYNILRNIESGLGNGNLIQGTLSHSGFAMSVGEKDKGSLVSSRLSNITTITESKEKSGTTTSVISTGSRVLLNKSTKSGFMSFRSMILSTQFSSERFTLIYGKYSRMLFYIQSCNITTKSTVETIENQGIDISLKYLDKICEKPCEQTCCKIGVCKICPIAKIRTRCLSISFKDMGLIIGNVSGDMLLNYLIESVDRSRDFITNLCVGFGEVYTIMLKNLLIWSRYPMNINNIENIGITNVETRNWEYETKYEHDVSTDRCFSNQYPHVSNKRASYASGSSNKAFKMILSRMLVGSVIVFVYFYHHNVPR